MGRSMLARAAPSGAELQHIARMSRRRARLSTRARTVGTGRAYLLSRHSLARAALVREGTAEGGQAPREAREGRALTAAGETRRRNAHVVLALVMCSDTFSITSNLSEAGRRSE